MPSIPVASGRPNFRACSSVSVSTVTVQLLMSIGLALLESSGLPRLPRCLSGAWVEGLADRLAAPSGELEQVGLRTARRDRGAEPLVPLLQGYRPLALVVDPDRSDLVIAIRRTFLLDANPHP